LILKNKIIPIYHLFLENIIEIEVPEEKIATCSSCTLCRSEQSPYIDTKCCSYYPQLPNFLIGGLLHDNDESLSIGQNKIKLIIQQQKGISPYGLLKPLPYLNTDEKLNSSEFWRRPKELLNAQLCPFYFFGNCSVWKYRENLCMTHFCSSVGGDVGKVFWHKVNQYLKMIETSLAQYAMLQLGWPPAKIKTEKVTTLNFNLEDEEGNINQENYKKLWGNWAGREEEFYLKCYEIVSKLDATTFKRITGLKREILEAAILDTQKDFLKSILPDILILNPEVISETEQEGFTVLICGEVSAKIPALILPLIRAFNGKRTTVEVFQLGFNVLYNMEEIVDELREKNILIKA
jgi:hypothetical protein